MQAQGDLSERSQPAGGGGSAEMRRGPLVAVGAGLFVVAATCAFTLSLGPILLGHLDLGWHLAAGDLMRVHGAVPATDPWSFTAGGKPWFNLSWLWDVGASALHEAGGLTALVLTTVALAGTIAGGLYLVCRACGAEPVAAALAVLAAGLVYPTFAAPDVFLAVSPNVVTTAMCVLFCWVCARSRPLWLLPPAMALWANLHGGFILGFALIGLFAGGALARGDRPGVIRLTLTGAACAAASLANPWGWRIGEGVFSTLGHFVQQHITEWRPWSPLATWPVSAPALAFIAIFLVLEATTPLRKGVRPEFRLLAWVFLALGFLQLRSLSLFFVFAAIPLSRHLTLRLRTWQPGARAGIGLAMSAIVLAASLPALYQRSFPGGAAWPAVYPFEEARWLLQNRPGARLLNHWNHGGTVIFVTRGAVPVFVDGRAATAYPDPVLRDYFRLIAWDVDAAAWTDVLDRHGIDTVMWPRVHEPLRAFLLARGWREAHRGPNASLFVRPGAGAS